MFHLTCTEVQFLKVGKEVKEIQISRVEIPKKIIHTTKFRVFKPQAVWLAISQVLLAMLTLQQIERTLRMLMSTITESY